MSIFNFAIYQKTRKILCLKIDHLGKNKVEENEYRKR